MSKKIEEIAKKAGLEYIPIDPTPTQIGCNAIRAMFFSRQYDGVVPVKDMNIVNDHADWHRIYGKAAIQDAIKSLDSEEYMNLDETGDNWLWGLPGTHIDMFPRYS